jgi:cell division protein ZapE
MSNPRGQLTQQYESLVAEGKIYKDTAQFEMVHRLDNLSRDILSTNNSLHKLLSHVGFGKNLRGLYLWGGVGRGKTFVMDMFFDAIPIKAKLRLHFHRFMHMVHHQLADLAGQSDPLLKVADNIRQKCRLLCFDEFFVTDITDAMLLGELFKALFERRVVLVATSNIPPEQLYRNGLQRERFLPAIDLIQQHCEVINVDGGKDYRLRMLEKAEIYHYPLDEAATANLQFSFEQLGSGQIRTNHDLLINDRSINTIQRCDGVVWFDFDDICQTERSASDYIELSRLYHTVLLANVPKLDDHLNDAVRRFIAMVDEFYERQVKLIMSAALPLEDLYQGSAQVFAFQRTQSRLMEMQTHHYLALPHLP